MGIIIQGREPVCFQKLLLSLSCVRSACLMAGAGPPLFLSAFVAQEA